jgi:hypothetical protein
VTELNTVALACSSGSHRQKSEAGRADVVLGPGRKVLGGRRGRAVQARDRRTENRYRPWADSVSIEWPPPSPRLIASSSSTSLARRAALTFLTSGKELPSCRALFWTATCRRFKTTDARAGETPFWTRARRSAICSGVQLRLDERTILNYSCFKASVPPLSDCRPQTIPSYAGQSVRRPTKKLLLQNGSSPFCELEPD